MNNSPKFNKTTRWLCSSLEA